MSIKVRNHIYFEGPTIIHVKFHVLLGEVSDIARDNLCDVAIRTYTGWELKRVKDCVTVYNNSVCSYIIQ